MMVARPLLLLPTARRCQAAPTKAAAPKAKAKAKATKTKAKAKTAKAVRAKVATCNHANQTLAQESDAHPTG